MSENRKRLWMLISAALPVAAGATTLTLSSPAHACGVAHDPWYWSAHCDDEDRPTECLCNYEETQEFKEECNISAKPGCTSTKSIKKIDGCKTVQSTFCENEYKARRTTANTGSADAGVSCDASGAFYDSSTGQCKTT